MSILPHDRNPNNPNWAYLSFPSGNAELQPDHRAWLHDHVFVPAQQGRKVWVHIRGLASHLGTYESNLRLSQTRAEAVFSHLLENVSVSPAHVTGLRWEGEGRAQGGPRDDSEAYRAVEVIVSFSPDEVRSAPAAPRQPRMIRRRVRCTLISEPRPDPALSDRGEAAYALSRAIRESRNVAGRIVSDTRDVPDDQRVVAIEFGKTSQHVVAATATTIWVVFTWGRSGGDTVRLTDRGATSLVSHAVAVRIYNHPDAAFVALDASLPGGLVNRLPAR